MKIKHLIPLLILSSCTLNPELQRNLVKDAESAGIGYLQAGKAGAVYGLTAQILINHSLTAAKQPRKIIR